MKTSRELCSYCVTLSGLGKLYAGHMVFSVGDLESPGFESVFEIRGPPLGYAFVSWSGGQKFVIKVWRVLPACAGAPAQAFLTWPEISSFWKHNCLMKFSLWPNLFCPDLL